MSILEIIAANKARQHEARQLNTRAGENVFKVFAPVELVEWLMASLVGARRMAEIKNPEALRLPELDLSEVARVERENPDTISLGGKSFTVNYSGREPTVFLGAEITLDGVWRNLPDDGVFLPGGRRVTISLGYQGWSTGSDTERLKTRVKNYLNQGQWERWPKPAIQLPDLKGRNFRNRTDD